MKRTYHRHGARAGMLILAMCAGAVCGSPTGKAAHTQPRFPSDGKINTDKTNLRAGRSLNYETVFSLDRGASVTVTGLEKGWFRIESPEDVPCYVSTRFLAEGKVICGRLNVRAKPSPKATVICQLERGDSVEEIEKNDLWTVIKAPDCAELWVSAELIDLIGDEEGGEKTAGEKEETPDEAQLDELPASSAAAGVKPPGEPSPAAPVRPAPVAAGTAPRTAPGPTGTPCRQQGKLARAEEMGVSGAPYCLVQGFFSPSVVCLLDSRTVNLSNYQGDKVKIWGYELSRHVSGIPVVDVRRLEVE
jgi:SH3-like domain-containing protein